MTIVPYKSREPVHIFQIYVCGNLHRFVFEPYELKANGKWESCGYHWFDTMSEVVVWAMMEGRQIDNWEECSALLEREEECRRAWERWMREEMVREMLPEVPPMIPFSFIPS